MMIFTSLEVQTGADNIFLYHTITFSSAFSNFVWLFSSGRPDIAQLQETKVACSLTKNVPTSKKRIAKITDYEFQFKTFTASDSWIQYTSITTYPWGCEQTTTKSAKPEVSEVLVHVCTGMARATSTRCTHQAKCWRCKSINLPLSVSERPQCLVVYAVQGNLDSNSVPDLHLETKSQMKQISLRKTTASRPTKKFFQPDS